MKRLTFEKSDEIYPVWSPDKKYIVFQSNKFGNWDIFIMKSDGSNWRRLTNHPADDVGPCFTKDGKKILFSSNRDGNFRLYSINVNGKDIKAITKPGKKLDFFPHCSPITGQIAYTSKSLLFPSWQIYLLNKFNDNPIRISPQSGCRAKWSPDGKYLAFVSEGIGGTTDIWIFKQNGKNLRRLTHNPEYDYDPFWSPDGSKICFARGIGKKKSGWNLWIIDIDGKNLRQLTNTNSGDRYPCWY